MDRSIITLKYRKTGKLNKSEHEQHSMALVRNGQQLCGLHSVRGAFKNKDEQTDMKIKNIFEGAYSANIYLSKANNRNIRKGVKYVESKRKTPERRQ